MFCVFPSLAPYFPKFLHARSAPKANQYVLDMAAQIEHDDHSLMEKIWAAMSSTYWFAFGALRAWRNFGKYGASEGR
jgi:hypothetical protein